MNKYTNAVIGLIALGASASVMAQDMTATNVPPSDWKPLYHGNELSLDLFGMGTVGQYTLDHLTGDRFVHHVRLGAGAGGNYFINRYFGVGVEAFSESTHHSTVDDLEGDLIGRFPIPNTCIAPYGFLGGGREWEPWLQWEGHVGVGVEFRVVRHFSVFVDGRYAFTEYSPNYGMGRAGIRLSF